VPLQSGIEKLLAWLMIKPITLDLGFQTSQPRPMCKFHGVETIDKFTVKQERLC